VVHADGRGVLLYGFAGLTLRAHQQHVLAARDHLRQKFLRQQDALEGFLDVDNVDEVPLAEDVRLHLGVPAADAVTEVDPRVNQIPDQLLCQTCTSAFGPD